MTIVKNKLKVVFFPVKDTSTKLSKICQTALSHFEKKEHFLIIAANHTALDFIDHLLWRLPEESFLPHTMTDMPSKDLICLSLEKTNINQASYVFNLLSEPLFMQDDYVKTIYEFEDMTSPDKQKSSKERYMAYRASDCLISSL